MGATLRLVGYAAQGLAARSPQFNFILYLLPLVGILIAGAVLRDISFVPMGLRRIFSPPVEEPA
jgi:hypothetical protein